VDASVNSTSDRSRAGRARERTFTKAGPLTSVHPLSGSVESRAQRTASVKAAHNRNRAGRARERTFANTHTTPRDLRPPHIRHRQKPRAADGLGGTGPRSEPGR